MAARSRPPSPILGAAAAMIGEASTALVGKESRFRHTFEIPLDNIRPDPNQSRKTFDAEEIAALAATMASAGQLQPILVRPDPATRGGWIIVAGERRWRAARLNGWDSILAIAHDGDPEIAALIENLQRVDLSPIEEARGLERLITGKGWTQNDAAAALGKSKAEISARLRILSLAPEVLSLVENAEPPVPRNVLVELARLEDPALQLRLARKARTGGLTVRAVRAAKAYAEAGWRSREEADEEAGADSDARDFPPDQETKFSYADFAQLLAGIRALQAHLSARPERLSPLLRTALQHLRAEIDAVLAAAPPENTA